jgi:Fe2+ or Zn2+ uptake regulation protein
VTALTETGELVDDLRGQGYKITTPRYRVIEWLAARDGNFSAEDLAADLVSVGRATVYRTLKLLLDQGLVCKVVLGDGSIAYRMSHKVHHHHLVCLGCGATEDTRSTASAPPASASRSPNSPATAPGSNPSGAARGLTSPPFAVHLNEI